jgi:hypothetical protein
MNRLDMEEEIAERVPALALRYKDKWKNAEKLRSKFVADYSIPKIRSMTKKLSNWVAWKTMKTLRGKSVKSKGNILLTVKSHCD